MTFLAEAPLHVVVSFAAGVALWFVGWGCDAATTWAGIRTHGIAGEANPLARRVFARLGRGTGFAALGLLEAAIIGTCVLEGLGAAAAHDAASIATLFLCLFAVYASAGGHLIAARGNQVGHRAFVVRPILGLYRLIDQALHRMGSAG